MKLLHRHNEQIEEIQKLTAELEKNPMVTKFREEEAAKTLKKRHEAAEKIEALKQEALALVTGKDELEEKLHKMKAERLKLEKDLNEKRVRFLEKKSGIEGQIRREKNFLYDSYDPKIDEGIEFFRKKLDELRSPGRISVNRLGGDRNIFTEKITSHTETNRGAVLLSMRYCMEAIVSLEAARLVPEVDLAKIEGLRSNIPRIDVYEEVQGERVMPGSKGINPLSLLPSDGAMEYKKRKLLEKAKKILK